MEKDVKRMQITYGNGTKIEFKTGDKVMASPYCFDLYPRIPENVKRNSFELVDFTKKGVPKLKGCDNHIYIISVENIVHREKYNELMNACKYLSQFEPK